MNVSGKKIGLGVIALSVALMGSAAVADVSVVAGSVKLVGVLTGDVDGSWVG